MTVPRGWAWVDGDVQPLDRARVPVTDRGFLLADSVFDTVRTYEGRAFLLGDHLDRLRRSASSLWMDVPWSDSELEDVVGQLLRCMGEGYESVVRIIVTRGDGEHGLTLPQPPAPRLVVLCRPLPTLPERLFLDGVKIARPTMRAGDGGGVPAHVKSGAYLSNILALRDGQAQGAYETLLPSGEGHWAEATTSNLFIVLGGALHTPGVRDHILPGVTRALVLAVARRASIEVVERPIADADLCAADEIFLTSSVKEVLPVVLVDSEQVGDGRPGPMTARVHELFCDATRELSRQDLRRLSDATGFGPG